jgi:hypothetical protein
LPAAAHACHSTKFDRLICRSQKSVREDAISREKRLENKVHINPTAHFLRRNVRNNLVKSGIARSRFPAHHIAHQLASGVVTDCCRQHDAHLKTCVSFDVANK